MKKDTEHIFAGHLLQPLHGKPVIFSDPDLVWPSFLLLFSLALLALVKHRSFQRVIRIVQSTFSHQILQQLEREESNPLKFHRIALDLFFLTNISFLIFKINEIYGYVLAGSPPFLQFLFFFSFLLVFLLLKWMGNQLISISTGERRLISDYLTSSSLVNQTFGLIIFPWIVLLQFSEINPRIAIGGALLFLGFSIMLKWYRGLIMGLVQERVGILQIFSYFCGLEILPLLVMVKYIIETF